MNNQITRRNLLKLLGVSGVTLPLTGISKDIDINPQKSLQNDGTIKLSSNENPYGPAPKGREAIINAFDEALIDLICKKFFSVIISSFIYLNSKYNINLKLWIFNSTCFISDFT